MTQRAPKGGSYGANGSWYAGGKFINTIAENEKRSGSKPKSVGKRQVDRHTWEVQPFSGARSIFQLTVGSGARVVDDSTIEPVESVYPNGVAYNGETIEECQALCDRFNRGERWV